MKTTQLKQLKDAFHFRVFEHADGTGRKMDVQVSRIGLEDRAREAGVADVKERARAEASVVAEHSWRSEDMKAAQAKAAQMMSNGRTTPVSAAAQAEAPKARAPKARAPKAKTTQRRRAKK